MPDDRAAALTEAYNRGLLPPEMKGAYEEAQRRGLLQPVQPAAMPNAAPQADDAFSAAAARTRRAVIRQDQPRDVSLPLMREPGIDYQKGASLNIQTGLAKADNPNEARLYLEKRVGPGNYGQDKYGNWWIKEGDKRVAVSPANTSLSGMGQNIAAGMMAGGPQTAGAIGGGVIGEAIFPLGGGIPGAMIGAAAGKGYNELVKWMQGTFQKTPAETVGGLSREGAVAGVFQGAGPIVSKAAPAVQRFAQSWLGTTPASRQMGRELLAGGASPPIGAVAPEATSMEYKRGLRNILSGDPKEAGRISYIDKRMRSVLSQEGIPDAQMEPMMQEIYDRSSRISTTEAGEKVTQKAAEIQRGLLQEADVAKRTAGKQLAQANQIVDRLARPPATLAADVAEGIRSERRNFSQQMTSSYRSVDRMTGDKPVVPTSQIQSAAKDLVKVMPPQAVPPIIKEWAQKGAPKFITFEQAHALRTTFREMSEMIDVSQQGQRWGNSRRLAQAADAAIMSTTDQVGQQAASALKTIDRAYGEGIAKFNDASINKLVRDVRSGLPPEPEVAARTIMNTDKINTAREIFKMVPPQARTGIIQADLRNLIDDASVVHPDGSRTLDGKTLMDILNVRSKIMDATYPNAPGGQQLLSSMRSLSRDLAVYDGKLDVTQIQNPTQITDLLQRAVGASRSADEFAKANPLGALASGEPQAVDRAAAYLTQPGKEAITSQAVRTLGVDSAEWRAVRKYALQNLFSRAVVETPSLGKTISGDTINKVLSAYTKKQQDLLFPQNLADDLRLLAKEVRFLFPGKPGDFGQSLAAASIKGHMPLAFIQYAEKIIGGWIADHPRVIKFLADEVRRDPKMARTKMSVMAQWILNGELTGPGGGIPESSIPQKAPKLEPEVERTRYGGVSD